MMGRKTKGIAALFKSAETGILTVMGVAMTLIMFANVIGRYVFQFTFTWAEESVRILFVASVFTAVTTGFIRNEHIGFNVLKNKNKSTRMLHDILYDLTLVFIGGVMASFGFRYTLITGRVPLVGTNLPEAVLLLPGVLAGAVWFLLGLGRLVRRIIKGGRR